ncbi:hypothetical protein FXB61_004542 [Bacillus cereus]|nr:hypothetical protein FXB61_004542 [Bacillus cereus]KFL63670.1 hypothetical protein DJ50_4569 [Bacillus cereus ATCC 10876]SUY93694.1 Uncharacterised protein [Bacillus cereus]
MQGKNAENTRRCQRTITVFISFLLLILFVCSSVVIIGATGGKYVVFLLLVILLNARITKEPQKSMSNIQIKGVFKMIHILKGIN